MTIKDQGQTERYHQYQRTAVAEMADWHPGFNMAGVSVSDADKEAGSPKDGDKIARNPANHADRWLVATDYFAANFAALSRQGAEGREVANDHGTVRGSYMMHGGVKALFVDSSMGVPDVIMCNGERFLPDSALRAEPQEGQAITLLRALLATAEEEWGVDTYQFEASHNATVFLARLAPPADTDGEEDHD